jgi:hypothetical protein
MELDPRKAAGYCSRPRPTGVELSLLELSEISPEFAGRLWNVIEKTRSKQEHWGIEELLDVKL